MKHKTNILVIVKALPCCEMCLHIKLLFVVLSHLSGNLFVINLIIIRPLTAVNCIINEAILKYSSDPSTLICKVPI